MQFNMLVKKLLQVPSFLSGDVFFTTSVVRLLKKIDLMN
jgi:hypothetical protein